MAQRFWVLKWLIICLGKLKNKWFILPAALFLFAGSLCKGVPALFPAVMPLLWRLTGGKELYSLKAALVHTSMLFAIPAFIYTLILFDPIARESLSFYFFERLLGRISGEPTVNSRFSILANFAQEFAVMFVIWIVVRFVLRRKQSTSPSYNRTLFLLLSGACGIVPLALTPVQRPFYMVPALAFFALAISIDLITRFNSASFAVSRKTQKMLTITAAVCVIALFVFTLTRVGKVSRDEQVLADVHAISGVVPGNGKISTSFAIYSKWDLQFYLLRYHGIVLESGPQNQYVLKEKTEDCDEGFEPCLLPLNELSLCRHRRE